MPISGATKSDREPLRFVPPFLEQRSTIEALVLAACIGLGYAIFLFGIAGVTGTSPFWQLPSLGASSLDVRDTLSGYFWYREERWKWPLLALSNPNWPSGTNAELFDIAPWFAILSKVFYRIFGWGMNPYPVWLTGCVVLNAVALTSLVRTMRGRSFLAAILAGAFGAMAPVVQYRFTLGHLALLAHWIPIFAVALYFHALCFGFQRRSAAFAAGLCALAAGVHLYLYVMTAAVVAALILQWVLNRTCSIRSGVLLLGALFLAGIGPLWAFGMLETGNLFTVSGDFTRYSMNVMSPFWPQTSGLFRWTGIFWLTRGTIGAHPGQYEGFDYLGGGVLLLFLVALWARRRDVLSALRHHPALAAAFVVLTLWALSNEIYFGPYLLFSYKPPQIMADTMLAWLRSSGRLFWPVGWFLVAFAIVQSMTCLRALPTLALAGTALAFQWIDTAPLRSEIRPRFSAPLASEFGASSDVAHISETIKTIGEVATIPAIFCSAAGADFSSPLNLAAAEIQLIAARSNAKMPSVYLARTPPDCTKRPRTNEDRVLIFLKDKGAVIDDSADPGDAECFELEAARVCSVKSAVEMSQ